MKNEERAAQELIALERLRADAQRLKYHLFDRYGDSPLVIAAKSLLSAFDSRITEVRAHCTISDVAAAQLANLEP